MLTLTFTPPVLARENGFETWLKIAPAPDQSTWSLACSAPRTMTVSNAAFAEKQTPMNTAAIARMRTAALAVMTGIPFRSDFIFKTIKAKEVPCARRETPFFHALEDSRPGCQGRQASGLSFFDS